MRSDVRHLYLENVIVLEIDKSANFRDISVKKIMVESVEHQPSHKNDNLLFSCILLKSQDSRTIEIILRKHLVYSLLHGSIVISGSRKFLLTLCSISPLALNNLFCNLINRLFAILDIFYSFTDRTISRISGQ